MKLRIPEDSVYYERDSIYQVEIGEIFRCSFRDKDTFFMKNSKRPIFATDLETGEIVCFSESKHPVKCYNMVYEQLKKPLKSVEFRKLKGGDIFTLNSTYLSDTGEQCNIFYMALAAADLKLRSEIMDLSTGDIIRPDNHPCVTFFTIEGVLYA